MAHHEPLTVPQAEPLTQLLPMYWNTPSRAGHCGGFTPEQIDCARRCMGFPQLVSKFIWRQSESFHVQPAVAAQGTVSPAASQAARTLLSESVPDTGTRYQVIPPATPTTVTKVHTLLRQVRPPVHTLPHAPQLLLSLLRSRQVPEQFVCPLLHTTVHALLTQACPVGHARLHAPQWALSVRGSRHAPPHRSRPPPHTLEHAPPEHTRPAPQTLPQAPQLALSVLSTRHTPEQFVEPAGHDTWHALPTQRLPAGQALPQAPQLLVSVLRSRHTPEHAV